MSRIVHDFTSLLTGSILCFSQTSCQQIMCDALRGLAYLHGSHIVHGDIKPDNIVLSEKQVAKISDFSASQVQLTYYTTYLSILLPVEYSELYFVYTIFKGKEFFIETLHGMG